MITVCGFGNKMEAYVNQYLIVLQFICTPV